MAVDEGLVDLDDVDGELPQIAEATSSRCRSRRGPGGCPARAAALRGWPRGRPAPCRASAPSRLISRVRLAGSKPVVAPAPRRCRRPAPAGGAGGPEMVDRQAERPRGAEPGPARRAPGASTSRSHPGGRWAPMSPISSATGMNSAGRPPAPSPRHQRTSASTPTMAPVASRNDRLVVDDELLGGDGPAQGWPPGRCAATARCACSCSKHQVSAPGRRPWARYMARSALRQQRTCALLSAMPLWATPTLALTESLVGPPTWIGSRQARR